MKTQEEIEQLAEQDFKFWQDCGHYELADLKSIDYYYDGFINGYFQCQQDMVEKYTEQDMIKFAFDTYYQEDMAKKYTEDDIYMALEFGRSHSSMTDKQFIESLNKQD